VVVVRVALLVILAAQLVFLAKRYKARFDMTADNLYTLTSSTQQVLDGLDERLLIEAYFTRDDKLPGMYQEARRELNGFLNEYERRSDGKVVVRYFDPESDAQLKQKAERIGIQMVPYESKETGQLRVVEVWQGLRLRYGGGKQRVIPMLGFQANTYGYETVLTPPIKDLTVKVKPKLALLAAPAASGGPEGRNMGFTRLRELVQARYDVSDLRLEGGYMIPPEIQIVVLVRPKNLTDRNKYAIDQFLMSGGKLLVFADTDEVDIGSAQARLLIANPQDYDAQGAKLEFLDQLAHYGAKVEDKVVADLNAAGYEFMARPMQTGMGMALQQLLYPYCFHVVDVDWGEESVAQKLARKPDGSIDQEMVEQFKRTFKPSLLKDTPLTKGWMHGPGMYWPCPVDLADPLPEGVTGNVVLRTSPMTIVEKAPRNLNPVGRSNNPRDQNLEYGRFTQGLQQRVMAEPRRQVGLLVELRGTFPSFFEGKDIPPKKPPEKAEDEQAGDPLKEPVKDPAEAGKEAPGKPEGGEAQGSEEPGPEPPGAEAKEGEKAGEGNEAPPAEVQGPPPPTIPPPPEEVDPPRLSKADPKARLVVVGDSDFIRDDLVSGTYGQLGPVSQYGLAFFYAILDWMNEDQDLLALRNKQTADRTLRFAEQDLLGSESIEQFSERVERKARWTQWLNILGPATVLLAFWLLFALARRARKTKFLSMVGG
jgi:ABC-type uncharacterized transport system involved in gliding motility auxiliary subunit